MNQKSLREYLALDWTPKLETVSEDGETSYRITVPLLPDFAVYGTMEEVGVRYAEALESHLAGYLAVGKCIPEPPSFGPAVTTQASETASMVGKDDTVVEDTGLVAA